VSVNRTLFEAKMCTFTLESRHFIFNKCPIYIHDGANAKFSTNSHETDYSVVMRIEKLPENGKSSLVELMCASQNVTGYTKCLLFIREVFILAIYIKKGARPGKNLFKIFLLSAPRS
jgi:hypothetical protein